MVEYPREIREAIEGILEAEVLEKIGSTAQFAIWLTEKLVSMEHFHRFFYRIDTYTKGFILREIEEQMYFLFEHDMIPVTGSER